MKPEKPKSRWAWFPVVLYLSFVAGLLSLARLAIQSPPNLVHEDYYERGLQHDATLAAEANAQHLGIEPQFAQTETGLTVTTAATITNATLYLQRPADATADRELPLTFVANSATLDIELAPGLWRYTLTGTADEKPCSVRGALHIQ
jgi:hypothetical protein